MTLLRRIEHVGITVADMNRSIAFYRDVLGLTLRDRRRLGAVELAFLTVGDDSAQIELVAGDDPAAPGDAAMNHLAFTVDALEPVVARLREHRVTIDSAAPIPIWDGMRVLFFRGPDGEKLELFERGI